MGGFAFRILGALALDPSAYEYVESRPASAAGAMLVVVASSVAAGVGAAGLPGPTSRISR
jgi:hypothetical protein